MPRLVRTFCVDLNLFFWVASFAESYFCIAQLMLSFSKHMNCVVGTQGVQTTGQTSDIALQRIARLEDANRSTFTSESRFYQPDEGGMVPHFTSKPKDLVLKEDEAVHAHCNVTPTNDANLQILWFKNGQPLTASKQRFLRTERY